MKNENTNKFYRSQIRIMNGEMKYCIIPKHDGTLRDWHRIVSISYCNWLATIKESV